jgi:hypothetical protein
MLQYEDGMFYEIIGTSGATRLIAKSFKGTVAKKVQQDFLVGRLSRHPWGLSIPAVIEFDKYIHKNLPDPTLLKPVVLLWARYSGGMTSEGYNPEGDSDVHGQSQLAGLFPNYHIITVGHNNGQNNGYSALYHLGEFYNRPFLQGTGRSGQLSFLLALMKQYPGRLFQMGQKTGGMDAGALVGIPTLYIEDKGSPSIDRMRSWTEDVVPFYRAAIIEEPPSLLGRGLRRIEKELKAGELVENDKKGIVKKIKEVDGKPMSRTNWRRVAMLWYLQELHPLGQMENTNCKTDVEHYKNMVLDLGDKAMKEKIKWEEIIKEALLDNSKLAKCQKWVPYEAGYIKKDLIKIQISLNNLVTDYTLAMGIGSNVRNQPGSKPTGANVRGS